MKRALKITLITLLSLLAVIIITVSVLTWVVFTPSKLTPIVRNQAQNYISCQTEIEEVELTFFSTFPQFGLKIKSLVLINPVSGAPSDTLMSSEKTIATIDIRALLKNNQIILQDVELNNLRAAVFSDRNGKTNYDVFKIDSTTQDTSAFENPFDFIELDKLVLNNANITYLDQRADMKANFRSLNGSVALGMKGNLINATLKAETPDISFGMDSTDYLKNASVKLNMPFALDLKNQKLDLNQAELSVNNLLALLSGSVELSTANDDIITDLNFETKKYPLNDLLNLVPARYLTSLEGIEMGGIIQSSGTIKGIFNSSTMPLIDVNAELENGNFVYSGFPYKLREMAGNADVKLDLNNNPASKIIINNFSARTGQSFLQGKGLIDYIMTDDMLFDLDMKLRFNLPELEPLLPENMNIKLDGIADGTATARFMLSDAMNMKLEKMNISGQFDANKLGIKYDSLSMYSERAKLNLKIPNHGNKSAQFLNAGLWCNELKVRRGKNMAINMHNINLLAETSNLMETYKLNNMLMDFNFDQMTGTMDNMMAHLDKSKGKAGVKMNFSDSISWPDVVCDFDVTALTASMDSIKARIHTPRGSFSMKSDNRYPDRAIFDLNYSSTSTSANMGSQTIHSGFMDVLANIVYNSKEENTLLQWTPTGHITMHDGKVKMDGLNADIRIPVVEFDFKPDEYMIQRGKLLVDNSDFELTGKLWNVSPYLRNEGLLMGDFKFRSHTADVYRIMQLTNGFGVEDSTIIQEAQSSDNAVTTASVTTSETSSGPYMVPKGMDLKLNAQIDHVLLGFDSARNMVGDLFVKDGVLVLEDMRFTTSAAKMQLTAMYRTPRRNHIFAGLDYHIMDMEISELLKMIPDIDSIMPMLRSFGGKGEFHIAVETYMDSAYNLKKSTLRGVSSIKGENLVLMDGETFSEIAKTLRFSKKAENKVDSLSAEFTIFKQEVDIYPFLIVMDKYKAVVAGRHNLDMNFDYHISVTDSPLPFRLGVDVSGNPDKMKFKPVKCKYANLYRPAARREIDTRQLEIRKMIRDALTRRVSNQ